MNIADYIAMHPAELKAAIAVAGYTLTDISVQSDMDLRAVSLILKNAPRLYQTIDAILKPSEKTN